MRAVVETQWLVVKPHSTTVSLGYDRRRDDRLAGPRRGFVLDRVAGRVGAERRVGLHRVVAHVDHRPAARAPPRQQPLDVALGIRIVALPPVRRVEAVLDVDQEQRGIRRQVRGGHGIGGSEPPEV
jgi:hypothetical protein